MKSLQIEASYRGLLFMRIPYCQFHIPPDISFIILPFSVHGNRKKRLKRILRKLSKQRICTGLWLTIPKNVRRKEQLKSFLNNIQDGLLTYPILLKSDSKIGTEKDLKLLCDEIRNMGFYTILWTDEEKENHKMDICASSLNLLNETGGIRLESKKNRIKEIFKSSYLLYANWDYGGFIKFMGWNVSA